MGLFLLPIEYKKKKMFLKIGKQVKLLRHGMELFNFEILLFRRSME